MVARGRSQNSPTVGRTYISRVRGIERKMLRRILDLNLRPSIEFLHAALAQIPANASVCVGPNIRRTNKNAERHKCHSAFLAGVAGFGPTNARVKVWCLTAWLYPNILLFQINVPIIPHVFSDVKTFLSSFSRFF